MKKDDIEQIYITDMTAHGMGVGRGADGAAVFVRGALPGDTVMAKCYRAKKKYAEAEAVEIVEPSTDRVESFCNVESCGGCQYCELRYEKQLEIKRRQIVQDLVRIGGLSEAEVEVDEVIGMDEPYEYRNKVTFQVGWGDENTPLVGFYRAGSHEIVDCPVCGIQAPAAAAVASSLRTFMIQEHLSVFDSKTKKGLLKDVIVRSCFATGEVMVVFEINGTSIKSADKLIDMMDEQINRVSGGDGSAICWSLESVYMTGTSGVPVLLAGKKTVSEVLAGVSFEISPLSFYQVNPMQTVKLYDKVFEYAALYPGDSMLDLYCGVGSIGLYLEDRMDDKVSVLGVESNRSAVLDANRNAVINGVINARYICGAAEEVVPEIIGKMSEQDFDGVEEGSTEWFARSVLTSVDVAVLDPPRAGCDEKLLAAVVEVSPDRIVYVSCDPATLARDVKYLTGNGYTFIKAAPVDMFPHTGHVETVVLLSRKAD